MTQDNSFTGMMGVRASKESFSGPMFQSVGESMPKPSQEFNTPTAGVEKDESMVMPEPVSNEIGPNMPPLNPRTNFRYQPDYSTLNGIQKMSPMAMRSGAGGAELTIEQTLAAMNDSTIMNQFASQTGLDGTVAADPTNLSLPTSAILDMQKVSNFLPPAPISNRAEEDILPPHL